VLYVCIPVHNEAATIGVLLWRLRTELGETGRDYEVVVYDDGSTDSTAEVLVPYQRVLPLTVLGGRDAPSRGRSAATETLLRHVASHSRYPRRDACVVMQADFTDRAEDVAALLPAFDAGADLVVGRRAPDAAQPPAERRLRRMGPWVLRPLVRVDGVDDLLTSFRLLRVAVLRDLVRARGAVPIIDAPGWAGVAELLVAALPFARRIEVVDTTGRYDVRTRPSRLDWATELRAVARYAWRARGTYVQTGPTHAGTERPPPAADPASVVDAHPEGARDDAAARRAAAPDAPPGRGERPRRAARGPHPEHAAPEDDSTTPRAGRPRASNAPEEPPIASGAEPDAEERPSTRRRRRRASQRAAERADGGAAASGDAADAERPDAAVGAGTRSGDDPATDGVAARRPTVGPDPSTPSDVAPDVAPDGGSDGGSENPDAAAPPRRKKRRRRARGTGGTGDAASPADERDAVERDDHAERADSPAAEASSDGARGQRRATSEGDERDGGERHDDERHDDERELGDGDAGESDEAAGESGAERPAGRRRKRRRSRSGKRASGVAPNGDPAARPEADGSDPGSTHGPDQGSTHGSTHGSSHGHDGATPAAAPPLDRSSFPA
jgi:hypothetical protein